MTRLRLFLRGMRMPFIVGGALALVFFAAITLINLQETNYGFFEVASTVGFVAFLIFVSFCFIGMFAPLRGLMLLQRQEKELGFSFNAEMKRRRAQMPQYQDDDFYVSVSSDRIVAVRRDYIAQLDDNREENRVLSYVTMRSRSGRKHRIVGHYTSIDGLETWYHGQGTSLH
ncbi:MAG: hypothetical protein FWE46_01410 [Coriobacteriia bacterium]|nr:hypothetical protein [Coriobacteriia bacterium]MCL2536700.1 hypothetical protein [Coriobacteriia bacterium]